MLNIKNLQVEVNRKKILKEVSLAIKPGEIHVIMGPNGAGKSTLSKAIAGHPSANIKKGDIRFEGKSVLKMTPDERAKKGIFTAFQYPREIAGVTMANFLRTAQKQMEAGRTAQKQKEKTSLFKFKKELAHHMHELRLPEEFSGRHLNTGFSGGEKKKAEMVQMKVLKPKLVILDEIDSGLDVDALRQVAKAVTEFKNKDTAVLIITHYQRILNYIPADHVHVMVDGRIAESGDAAFAQDLEKHGYEKFCCHKQVCNKCPYDRAN